MGDLDLVIKQASLRGRAGSFDVGLSDGRITAISPSIHSDARQVIQCEGNLVTESFVNPHLHLDKVYTLAIAGEAALLAYTSTMMGGAIAAIDGAARVKELQAAVGIADNARRAVNLALSFGTTHMRALADVDTKARLEGVKALLEVREEFRGRLTLQVVAFPQQGLLRDAGAQKLVLRRSSWARTSSAGFPGSNTRSETRSPTSTESCRLQSSMTVTFQCWSMTPAIRACAPSRCLRWGTWLRKTFIAITPSGYGRWADMTLVPRP